MTDHIFISSPVDVLTGDAARAALQTTNDAAHYTEGKGVLSVPPERWRAAQAYERDTWLTYGQVLSEDRNAEHAAMFDNYSALPENLGDVIELGCGPFTNWIYIRHKRRATSITLLDPMAYEYMREHRNCTYRDDIPINIVWWGVHWIENSSIEDYDSDDTYDTIVMINVLPHCQSVETVFAWIKDHLRPGGYLVFHEPARDVDPARVFDVGHPLSYTQEVIDAFLAGYEPRYRNGDYFIGVKK
jgi:SAM-dependent methyltransferase